jgi:hypothetical protein
MSILFKTLVSQLEDLASTLSRRSLGRLAITQIPELHIEVDLDVFSQAIKSRGRAQSAWVRHLFGTITEDADHLIDVELIRMGHTAQRFVPPNTSFATLLREVMPCVGTTALGRQAYFRALDQREDRFNRAQIHSIVSGAIESVKTAVRRGENESMWSLLTWNLSSTTISLGDIAWRTLDMSIGYKSNDVHRICSSFAKLECLLSSDCTKDFDRRDRNELIALLVYCYGMLCSEWSRLERHAPEMLLFRQWAIDEDMWHQLLDLHSLAIGIANWLQEDQGRIFRVFNDRLCATVLLLALYSDTIAPQNTLTPDQRLLRSANANDILPYIQRLSTESIHGGYVKALFPRIQGGRFTQTPSATRLARDMLERAAKRYTTVGYVTYAEVFSSIYLSGYLCLSEATFLDFVRAKSHVIDTVAAEAETVSPEAAVRTFRALETRWPQLRNVKFNHVVQLAANCGVEATTPVSSIVDSLGAQIGADASMIDVRLRDKLCAQSCEQIVATLPPTEILVKPVLRCFFEKLGYIFGESDCSPRVVETVASRSIDSDLSGATKAWKEHAAAYKALRFSTAWIEAEEVISGEARSMIRRMVDGERIIIANVLEEKWYKDVKRVLIARRILIGYAKLEESLPRRLYQMGWSISTEFKSSIKIDTRAYDNYRWNLGLPVSAIKNPAGSCALLPEELTWYETL